MSEGPILFLFLPIFPYSVPYSGNTKNGQNTKIGLRDSQANSFEPGYPGVGRASLAKSEHFSSSGLKVSPIFVFLAIFSILYMFWLFSPIFYLYFTYIADFGLACAKTSSSSRCVVLPAPHKKLRHFRPFLRA